MNPIGGFGALGGMPPGMLKQLAEMTQQSLQTSDLTADEPATKTDFKSLIMESVNQVNQMQQDADIAIETLMTGGDINPAQVLTAIQKADMSFRMMQQIRNKLMDAYREIKDIRI